ncbi:HTH_Tnp_Tc3_2 domain-containing protein [Trichonephila clavipes]|nr:HTH_Tnp_Tc3_2 domain-containing protein [Trichonephila clavipes]
MASHTITPAACRCKCRIESFTTGSPRTNTSVTTAEIESGFVAEDDVVPFRCSPVSSCVAPRQMEASMGGCQGQCTGSQKVECTVAEGQGRPRNTNDREDRAIRRVATSAPTTSLASIQRHLPPSRHPVPSRETIFGLRSRRPLRRLPLTPHHRQCRLDFCRPRATWSVTDWRRVIFSDESRFSLMK